MGMYLIGMYLMGVYLTRRPPRLRVFLARRTRVARISVMTPRRFKASDCGRFGRQVAGHPWNALRVVKSCRKDRPTAKVLLEAKAAALHPERYQSSLSKLIVFPNKLASGCKHVIFVSQPCDPNLR